MWKCGVGEINAEAGEGASQIHMWLTRGEMRVDPGVGTGNFDM